MSITRFSIPGFVHFYRSILRFCHDISNSEAAELTYLLNTANMDTYRYCNPHANLTEASPVTFYKRLTTLQRRPYRTEIQFYRAMEALQKNILPAALTTIQLQAVMRLYCMMDNTEFRFFKAFDMEIDDRRTIYRECVRRLVPRYDEPGVCLLVDWYNLPMA